MDTTGATLEFPTSRDLSTRLDWATGKMWDFAEGMISRPQLALVGAMLYGWADLATEDEKRQYRALGKQVNELVKSSEEDMQPNRALSRHQLETIAWQVTPEDYRAGSGSRRSVLVSGTQGTTTQSLSDMTDNQIRKYIGPRALEEAGDMKKNGKGIYSGTAAGQDDYVIHQHGTSGKYYADRVGRGGTHIRIGGARGVASVSELRDLIRKDAHSRGRGTGDIFEQRGDELVQTDQVGSKFRLGDRVVRIDDQSFTGKIGYVGSDQGEEYGGYQYKVDWDNGAPRHYVPGNKLRLMRGGESYRHAKNASRQRPPAAGHYVDHGDPVFIIGDNVERKGGAGEGSVVDIGTSRGRLEYLVKLRNGDRLWFDESELVVPAHWKENLNRNGKRAEPDETAARELSLYIENDYALVGAPNSRGKAIEQNLLKKIRAGTFDLTLSEKLWMYLMEDGAKKYSKELSDGRDWGTMFNKATRELVAHEFATTFYEENRGPAAQNGDEPDEEDGQDFTVEEFDAPAHWASAFVNGDLSGMDDDDIAEYEAWCAEHPDLGWVVGVSEESHFGRWNGLQTQLSTYTAHVR